LRGAGVLGPVRENRWGRGLHDGKKKKGMIFGGWDVRWQKRTIRKEKKRKNNLTKGNEYF